MLLVPIRMLFFFFLRSPPFPSFFPILTFFFLFFFSNFFFFFFFLFFFCFFFFVFYSRLGAKFLKAGVGFGGSCFRKDLLGLIYLCKSFQLEEVAEYWAAVLAMNDFQKERYVRTVLDTMFGTICRFLFFFFFFCFLFVCFLFSSLKGNDDQFFYISC